jgi:hypothetical protein
MSEPISSPSLPSTADETPYVPVSWVAAAAATVSAVSLLTLGVFGYFAFVNKKPLIELGLLALPAVALVLCFAARRVIRNSEGTRTDLLYGVSLVNAAWWLALVLGLCYGAYLFAIDYAIRREAEGELKKWTDALQALSGGRDEDMARAFYRTIPPGKRQDVAPNDVAAMRSRGGPEFLAFANSDLVRLAQRNADALKFLPGAVSWERRPGGVVECLITATAECREGRFPIAVRLSGEEAGTATAATGRQWRVVPPQEAGFIEQSRVTRTAYGWLVWELEREGGGFGRDFVKALVSGPEARTYLYQGFIRPGTNPQAWAAVAGTTPGRVALGGGLGAAVSYDNGYPSGIEKNFFRLRDGTGPPVDKKALFLRAWNELGVRPAGERLKNPPDKDEVVTVTDAAVEVRLPLEIVLPGKAGDKPETARGLLVAACSDAALLELVKRYKESADPAQGTVDLPSEVRADLLERFKDPNAPQRWSLPWRVVHIESNLEPVNVPTQRPGGPAGPSGLPAR